MSEFEVRPLSEMPGEIVSGRRTGITKALRNLLPGQVIFVSCREGESLHHLAARVSGNLNHGTHRRIDRERNGVWLYKDGATP